MLLSQNSTTDGQAPSGEIVCVCSQKVVVLGDREKAQREQAQKAASMIKAFGIEETPVVLPGGAIASRSASQCEAAGCVAAFLGWVLSRPCKQFLPLLRPDSGFTPAQSCLSSRVRLSRLHSGICGCFESYTRYLLAIASLQSSFGINAGS